MSETTPERQRAQQMRRMASMPWLYHRAKPAVRAWAEPWQAEVHAEFAALERVQIDGTAFVAPDAEIFAEPHRDVIIGPRASVASGAFVHGPVHLAAEVSINRGAHLEGAKGRIEVGMGTRIATGATLVAFDHGIAPGAPIRAQAVRSRGIRVGADVWIGARAVITDGVTIGEGAVVGAGAVVTRDIPPGAIALGVPARVAGHRDTWG